MQAVRLLSEFVADLAFTAMKTIQLKDQGPAVRGQLLSIDKPLALMSGELAEGSEVVNEFPLECTEVEALLDVMRKAKDSDAAWMCAPLYRDALIFLNGENEVIGVLNICFSCHHLLDGLGNRLSCDEASFTMLGELFKSFGHLVDREG